MGYRVDDECAGAPAPRLGGGRVNEQRERRVRIVQNARLLQQTSCRLRIVAGESRRYHCHRSPT
jgi:hypothetical protein